MTGKCFLKKTNFQSWFWYLCGGLILLAIIGSIVGSVLCCCRGRGRGGTDQSIDEEASEPSDQSQKP
ncbi:hypothetical protein L5515_015742 [Caenorhabditis briggsae]|uniref:Uncharacterized protein n=1 Tax=Caenorhabditis briggsae TaxID=6238 RepID=A0AAE9DPI5_CAEBR|nr:hypothetical protein L3Y34_019645 [Caenorhabditis briggsae]UMM20485.1 hypothetical protein L5515_015742 [Caenorhabditis briggsae]